DRVRRVVAASGHLEEPTWASAFAFAEGRRDDARRALARGLAKGDRRAAAALLALAIETRDLDALHVLASRHPALLPQTLRALREASALLEQGRGREALNQLDTIGGPEAGWAAELRREVIARWLPQPSQPGEAAPAA